eukprot:2320262-Prymnesium_polylepis.1
MLVAAAALRDHDHREQVLWVDSGTYVKDDAGDIFAECAGSAVCAYSEGGGGHLVAAQARSHGSAASLRAQVIEPQPEHYVSLGVVVFGRRAL